MKITFTKPVTVGDIQQQVQVVSMDVVTIGFNLAPMSGGNKAVVSLTLRDSISGYQTHYIYEDAVETRQFWEQVSALQINGQKWLTPLLNRMIADGKLPDGTLS
jgi:hypothetical protein